MVKHDAWLNIAQGDASRLHLSSKYPIRDVFATNLVNKADARDRAGVVCTSRRS